MLWLGILRIWYNRKEEMLLINYAKRVDRHQRNVKCIVKENCIESHKFDMLDKRIEAYQRAANQYLIEGVWTNPYHHQLIFFFSLRQSTVDKNTMKGITPVLIRFFNDFLLLAVYKSITDF